MKGFTSRAWLIAMKITCESDLVEARKELKEMEDARRKLDIQIALRKELLNSINTRLDDIKEQLNDDVKERVSEKPSDVNN